MWDLEEEDLGRRQRDGKCRAQGEGRGGEVHLGPIVRTCSSLGLGGSVRDWGEAGAGLGWQPRGEQDEESDVFEGGADSLCPIIWGQVKEREG